MRNFFRAIFSTLLSVVLIGAGAPLYAQPVEIIAPQNVAESRVTNDTGVKLRLHVFYGHDTAQLIAFHETDLNVGQTINLDRIAEVVSDQIGGDYVLNVWRKGWGLIPFDQHWKKGLRVSGNSRLVGTKGNVRVEGKSNRLSAIRVQNNTQLPITAWVYNQSDTWRLVAATSRTIAPGEVWSREYFSKPKYRLVLKRDGVPFFSKVVTSKRLVRVHDAPLSLATFNVKLMTPPLAGSDSYTEAGVTADYESRLAAMAQMSKGFDWDGAPPTGGFGVVAYQEVWRPLLNDTHYKELKELLLDQGLPEESIVRGTGKGFEAGYHHGLVLASRYPVIERDELKFFRAAGGTADWLVEKGALYMKIDVNGKHVAVFNTHLQADESGERSSTRSEQLKILLAFITEKSVGSSATIVMGDFNVPRPGGVGAVCAGIAADGCRAHLCASHAQTEYCQWFSNAGLNGDWSDFVDYAPQRQIKGLDYILVKQSAGVQLVTRPKSSRIYVNAAKSAITSPDGPTAANGLRHITDHPAVYGEFNVIP